MGNAINQKKQIVQDNLNNHKNKFHMKQQTVYILQVSDITDIASKNLKVVYHRMYKSCQERNTIKPHSYPQVTRLMLLHKEYIHLAGVGTYYKIITRDLVHTPRIRKNPSSPININQ